MGLDNFIKIEDKTLKRLYSALFLIPLKNPSHHSSGADDWT